MDGIARSGLGTQGYGYDSSSSVNELHSMDDGAARAPPGRAGFLPVMIPLIPRWPVRIECATPPDSPSIPRIRQPASSRAPRGGRPRATRTRLSRCCDVGHGRLFRGRPGASSLPRREWSGRGRRGGRVLRSVRRLPARRPPRPACGGSLSKSATKAPIEPERARRNVDIPRFSSPPIPARSAFVADLDTPPPRVATGAPPAPRRHPQITFMASELIRTADVEVGVSGPRPPRRRTQGLLLRARHRGGRPRARARAGPAGWDVFSTVFRRYSGAAYRVRTDDLLFTRQPLYRLS